MESTLKNMVMTLLLITLAASAAVGVVYQVTKDPIESAKTAKTMATIGMVVPAFDNNPSENKQTVETERGEVVVYTAAKGDEIVGYAIETSANGFNGAIKLMAGFLPDGSIYKIEVLQHTETPGLGDKIESKKSSFSTQFEGKNLETFNISVKKDGGEVDAITASTISSRAYVNAVKQAYDVFLSINK